MISRLLFALFLISVGGGFSFASDVGMVAPFITDTCPIGWIPANGQPVTWSSLPPVVNVSTKVSVELYITLYNEMHQFWGSVNNGFVPTPPINSGLFIRGVGGNADVMGKLQLDDFKSHTHIQNSHSHFLQSFYTSFWSAAGSPGWATISLGSDYSHNNTNSVVATNQNTGGVETRPKNIALLYCIKAFNDSVEVSTMAISSITIVGLSTEAVAQINPGVWQYLTGGDISFGFGVIIALVIIAGLTAGMKHND